jgi:hypothetical protein
MSILQNQREEEQKGVRGKKPPASNTKTAKIFFKNSKRNTFLGEQKLRNL